MKTLHLNNEKKSWTKAVKLLQDGEVVAFPTETVYGLGTSIFQEQGLIKIFEIKGRNFNKPLTVHLSNVGDVEKIAIDIPENFYKLAKFFLPGPLTLILKKRPTISSLVSKDENIAIRVPSHPIAIELITLVGEPIVGTSVNKSGEPPLTCGKDIFQAFQGKISAVIDDGNSPIGKASTVLSLLEKNPKLLRLGSINKAQLEESLECFID